MVPQRFMQAIVALLIGGVDIIVDRDDANSQIDGRVDQFAASGFVTEEAAAVLHDNQVPATGRNTFPNLVDARPVDELTRQLGIVQFLDLGVRNVFVLEKPPAIGELIGYGASI